MSGAQPDAQAPPARWDMSNARTIACDVATASAGVTDVVLNLGTVRPAEGMPGAVSTSLMHRISLPPRTAQNLRTLLQRLVAEAEQTGSKR